MKDQLKELMEMQRVLDENIMKEHELVYDEHIANNIKVALIVELGELMNEFPTTFKHWSKTAVDNREKGLVEYVDCLHFILSLMNYCCLKVEMVAEYDECVFLNKDPLMLIVALSNICNFQHLSIEYLFDLGNFLGFTWPEIYQAYKDKNVVNYERLKENY